MFENQDDYLGPFLKLDTTRIIRRVRHFNLQILNSLCMNVE